MHFVRAVSDATVPCRLKNLGDGRVVCHTHTAERLHGAICHRLTHGGGDHLDHGDVVARAFRPKLVHLVGGCQHQQPALLDLVLVGCFCIWSARLVLFVFGARGESADSPWFLV